MPVVAGELGGIRQPREQLVRALARGDGASSSGAEPGASDENPPTHHSGRVDRRLAQSADLPEHLARRVLGAQLGELLACDHAATDGQGMQVRSAR